MGRPLLMSALNGVGWGLRRFGWPRIEPSALMRAARRRTGLEDFGGDDLAEPLELLVQSAEREARLTPVGRLLMREELIQRLSNRLLIEEALKADPGIREERVDAPVVILGFPRSGTTHLHRLLACDPASRVPRTWEMSAPAPPPRPETDDTDPRIAKVQRFLGLLTWAEPALPAIHELGARLPEECISLMANDLVSIWFTVAANLPSYWRWYHEQDLTAAYQRHRRQLQLLQRHLRADRWVLKAPVHMHGLAYLLDVYPDARVVFTHRNPAEVVASSASLIVHFQRALADGVDPHATGALMLESMVQYHERARAARAAAESRSDRRCVFLDVDYADVVRAPLETVERIYRTFSLPFGEPVRRRMQDYLAENAQHRHGVHRYELGQFGLSRAQVEERFPATERV